MCELDNFIWWTQAAYVCSAPNSAERKKGRQKGKESAQARNTQNVCHSVNTHGRRRIYTIYTFTYIFAVPLLLVARVNGKDKINHRKFYTWKSFDFTLS